MFNFTTQTILNDVSGKKIQVAASGKKPALRVGNIRFDKDNVLSVEVKKPTPEALASVTFDMASIIPDDGEVSARVALYINLSMNNQDSFYSNDLVYKGKPLYVEFMAKSTDDATTVGARLVANAKKYFLFMTDQPLLNVTNTAGKVKFEAVNGYQIISKAALQKFDPEAVQVDCCATQGDFVDVVVGVPVIYKVDNGVVKTKDANSKQYYLNEDGAETELAANQVAILPGLEAFGDYSWIMHNLRLPTAANTNFWAVNKEEMPSVGNTYSQITVKLMAVRDGIAGQVVGQRATSITTHVFYVAGDHATNGTPANTLKAAFTTLLGADAATKILTTADTELANPYNTSKTFTA